GDLQVPEGIYRIEALNPNSRFHLSMRLNYPNEFDRRNAWLDRRRNLGGDIFIHGNELSVGCLAMGDSVIEELFVLFATLGPERNRVVIAPHDPRREPLESSTMPDAPWWLNELYLNIGAEFRQFR
ncbi:MAG: L,D-transpeptidase family protein, partial [Gammaproteobacteria bacterium]